MEVHQLKYLVLSSVLLGIVCKKSINDLFIYYNRRSNLNSISDSCFLSSDRIRKEREKIDKDLELVYDDNKIMENINLFLKNYTKEELLILKKNIQTLKIGSDVLDDDSLVGIYNLEKNEIIACEDSLNHELHHVASTLGLVDGVMVSGFMQDKDGMGIGMGINEGYTEYLSLKQVNNQSGCYERIVKLIPLIELLFDDRVELRKMYFNTDLESLIDKIARICGREESINLIKDIDKLMFYEGYKTWFDKTNIIDLSIRIRLLEYYERLSGNLNCKELFIGKNKVDEYNKIKKLAI